MHQQIGNFVIVVTVLILFIAVNIWIIRFVLRINKIVDLLEDIRAGIEKIFNNRDDS